MVSAVSIAPVVAAVTSLVLMIAGLVMPQRRTRSIVFFVALNATAVVWSVAYFLRLNYMPTLDPALASPGTPEFLITILWAIGASGNSTYWFLFGCEQARWSRFTHGWGLVAAHSAMALTLVGALTNSAHHLFVRGMDGNVVVFGPLAQLDNVLLFLMGPTGLFLFLRALWNRPEARRLDVVSLALCSVIPFAGGVLWMTRDVTRVATQALAVPVLQPVVNVALTVIIFRTGIAEIMPDGVLSTIMENTDTLIAYLSPRLEFVTASAAFLTRAHLTEKEIGGRALADVVRDPRLRDIAENARQLRERVEHHAWPDVLGEQDVSGSSYWNWSLKPVMSGKRLRGFVLSLADVTEEVRDAAFSTALGNFTRKLHASLDPEVDLPPVLVEAGTLLGADTCGLVLGSEGEWRRVRPCEGRFDWEPFDPGEWSHFSIALRMRRPVVIDDASSASSGVGTRGLEEGVRRVLTLPLVLEGETVGALSFGASSPGCFTPPQVAYVHELVKVVTGALESAREHRAHRQIADTLQDALLGVPPEIAGLEVATAYRSATRAARVGGDLYDLFEVEPGMVALIIADIAGKGVEAASLTSLVKSTLRSVALRYLSPGRILLATNDVLRRQLEVGRFATAFVGLLDLESGLLRYASAGHPGPFVLRREGRVDRLERNPGLLGVFEDMTFPVRESALERGDLVLMYTDGLIETRKTSGPIEEDLMPFLAQLASQEPSGVVDALITHATEEWGGATKDDIAVMAVRLA